MSTTEHHAMRVLVLGPLSLVVEGRDVAVPGTKRRAALALLALADGATVSSSELIDAVWPDDPPARADGALQSHISRLRAHLGAAGDRLTSSAQGYRLLLRPGELDVHLVRDGLQFARRVGDDDPGAAAERLAAARGLWRGTPLAEFDGLLPIVVRRLELDDLCQEVDELLVRCALRAGHVDRAVQAASTAAAARPTSEASAMLRMQALATAGRRTEALRAAAELRQRLRDELGLEPSAELIELERAIAAGAEPPASGAAPAVAVTTRDSIPLPTSSLIGREAEVGAVQRLLESERFVTIVGTGGVGKTRLAAELARRHDDDTHWVALAPLTDPGDLPPALAMTLGLENARGDALDACARLLGAGRRLLVLDNCEHVLDVARDVVTRLLRACPQLTVLTTSRQRLGLADECTVRLGPLALPDPNAAHRERAPALAVFLDRARRARPGFETDAEELDAAVAIVRRLDGLPLAIELAAGRLSFLSVGDLRDRLDRALDLLHGGRGSGDERHQTLRATLAWSYELLPRDRQRLLEHLAVFPDGADLATAEMVAGEIGVDGDPTAALGHLVDASMLDAELDGRPRYRMLDSLRAFALERLDAADERDAAELRLLQWAEELTDWIDVTLRTPDEPSADARLRHELANLRAAWGLAMRRGAIDTAISIIVALDDAAQWRELPEVWGWAQALAVDARLAMHPRAAAALATASDCAWLQGNLERASVLAETALAHAGDDDGRSRALMAASVVRLSLGEFRSAADLALEAATITSRPEHARLVAALATAYAGDFESAAAINATVVAPAGPTERAEWEYTAAELASIAGRYEDAERHYRRAIELACGVGASFLVGIASVGLLTVLRVTGRHAEALRGYRDVLSDWEQAGNWIQVWTTIRNLADLLAEIGDEHTARSLLAAADRAPDAPAVGDSAWRRPALGPDVGSNGTPTITTRDDAIALAVQAIDRNLSDVGSGR